MKDLYAELGLDKNATEADIKKAYKRKAARHHPDREGGDTEAFKRMKNAYEILKDPERRAQYDQDGTTGPATNGEDRIRNALVELLLAAADTIDPKHTDLIIEARKLLHVKTTHLDEQASIIKRKTAKLDTIAERITRKAGEDNVASQAFHHIAQQHRSALIQIKLQLEECAKIEAALNDYSYRTDEIKRQSYFTASHPFTYTR